MADFKAAKVVAAVPTPPEPDTVYFVRSGSGFDIYVTNGVGQTTIYALNAAADAREWSADTVPQAEAEAGTATTRRAWSSLRVRQAITAWWNSLGTAFGRGFISLAGAAAGRSKLELGTAATRDVGTGSGNVMEVGAGGWVSRAAGNSYISGYPQTIEQNISQIYRRDSGDNGVSAYAASIHFAAEDTWGRVRVRYDIPQAWIQGGTAGSGAGWTVELIHTGSSLSTTGQSTQYPMTQKAVTDALDTKANASTQVIAGTGLSGGGNLSANRTLSVNYGTTAGTAAQGNDSRITGAAQKSANLSDLVNAGAARQNLGLGTAATRDVGVNSGELVVAGTPTAIAALDKRVINPSDLGGNFSKKAAFFFTSRGGLVSGSANSEYGDFLALDTYSDASGGRINGLFFRKDGSGTIELFSASKGATNWTSVGSLYHTGNILTTTGQSTQYPMTQKAVTDAINARGFVDASGVLTATSGALSNDMSSFLSQTTKATMRSNLGAAAASHTHSIAGIGGLSTELAGKAALNATSTVSGGLKARLSGTTLYLTNNGTNP